MILLTVSLLMLAITSSQPTKQRNEGGFRSDAFGLRLRILSYGCHSYASPDISTWPIQSNIDRLRELAGKVKTQTA